MASLIPLGRGAFAVGPRPRGSDWLESDLSALRELGFSVVVSLLTAQETHELELVDERDHCDQLGLQFLSYPIPDMTVPSDRGAFNQFVDSLFARVFDEGGQAYCHCRAGLGRAPLLGCSLLMRGGLAPTAGWTLLSSKRGHTVPETPEQREWVEKGAPLDLQDALDSLSLYQAE